MLNGIYFPFSEFVTKLVVSHPFCLDFLFNFYFWFEQKNRNDWSKNPNLDNEFPFLSKQFTELLSLVIIINKKVNKFKN